MTAADDELILLALALRSFADPKLGLARGFDDAQDVLRTAADAIESLREQVAAAEALKSRITEWADELEEHTAWAKENPDRVDDEAWPHIDHEEGLARELRRLVPVEAVEPAPTYDDPVKGDGPCAACGHDPACGYASTYNTTEGERWFCHTDGHSCYAAADLTPNEGRSAVRRKPDQFSAPVADEATGLTNTDDTPWLDADV